MRIAADSYRQFTACPVLIAGLPAVAFGGGVYTPAVSGGMDSTEIAALFQRHGALVYRRALRLMGNQSDAEEVVQEVFVRVMVKGDSFEQRSQISTWLYRITTNHCLNLIRNRTRRGEKLRMLARQQAVVAGTGAVSADNLVLLRAVLADADEEQAAAAIYVYVDGMSHREAAKVMGVSHRTVGNQLNRFTERARAMAAELGEEGELTPEET